MSSHGIFFLNLIFFKRYNYLFGTTVFWVSSIWSTHFWFVQFSISII